LGEVWPCSFRRHQPVVLYRLQGSEQHPLCSALSTYPFGGVGLCSFRLHQPCFFVKPWAAPAMPSFVFPFPVIGRFNLTLLLYHCFRFCQVVCFVFFVFFKIQSGTRYALLCPPRYGVGPCSFRKHQSFLVLFARPRAAPAMLGFVFPFRVIGRFNLACFIISYLSAFVKVILDLFSRF
jgi:hypothetical protein